MKRFQAGFMTSPHFKLAGLWALDTPPPNWGWWAVVPQNGFSFSLSRGRGPANAGGPSGLILRGQAKLRAKKYFWQFLCLARTERKIGTV